MQIEKVRIRNYLSIRDSGEVSLHERITCVIGKNESGKTNFLRALSSFSSDYEYTEDDLCSYSEVGDKMARAEIVPEDIDIVTIWFTLDKEDRDRMTGIDKRLRKVKTLRVTKHFDNSYTAEIPDLPLAEMEGRKDVGEVLGQIGELVSELSTKLQQHAQRHGPFAGSMSIYAEHSKTFLASDFQDATSVKAGFGTFYGSLRALPNKDTPITQDIDDAIKKFEECKAGLLTVLQADVISQILAIVPDCIYFDEIDQLTDSLTIDEFLANPDQHRTLANLLSLAGLSLERIKTQGVYLRRHSTEEASAVITGLINESWKQEKVEVKMGVDGDRLITFVQDEAGAFDPPSRRSKGFLWFLSFYVNFTAGSKGELKNTILLIDDPGVYLHPSGQRDLLRTLERIAENNQIVYSTHSPFLIDRDNIGRIRIVDKRSERAGTKIADKFHDTRFDSLEPIRAAIGATIGDSLFGNTKNVIVEGLSDYFILTAFLSYLQRTADDKRASELLRQAAVVPVGGAEKVPYFSLLVWKEGYKFVALLDNDTQGRRVYKQLVTDYPINESQILKLDEVTSELKEFEGRDIEIEDLLNGEFYNKAVNQAYEDIFRSKGYGEAITLSDLDSSVTKRTKKYAQFFKNKRLGAFDKVLVAKEVLNLMSDKSCDDTMVGRTAMELFDALISLLHTKLK